MAPILCFTADEIWLSMPHRSEDDGRNVLFNDMNAPFTQYALSEEEMLRWSTLIQLRNGVNAALESARAEKKIGKALEARVVLVTDGPAAESTLARTKDAFEDQWADLFIVSDVAVSEDAALYAQGAETGLAGVRVTVESAPGAKCQRCWKQLTSVGTVADHPTLCARCAAVVAQLPEF